VGGPFDGQLDQVRQVHKKGSTKARGYKTGEGDGKKLEQINEINATFIEMKFAVKTKLKRRNKRKIVKKKRIAQWANKSPRRATRKFD